MSTLTFDIPATLWLSANDRHHWREKAKRTKALREMGYVKAKAERVPAYTIASLAVYVGYPTSRRSDPANSYPTVKGLVDGMTDAGVWPDDDSAHLPLITFGRDPDTKTPGRYRLRMVLMSQEVPF